MRQSAEISELAKALIVVQSKLQPIVKDGVNPHFNNAYVSLDAMMGEVRLLLAENGLAVIQGSDDATAAGIPVTTMLVHSSGQWIASTYVMPLEKQTAQAAGSAITYGRRYGLGALLALATETDDDGNAASTQTRKAARPRPRTNDQRQSAARAVADSVEDAPITKDSLITFGTLAGTPIRELKDSYLRWALEDGRHFGPRTEQWQAAFRAELASRDGVKA